ncbi:lysophospholipid acyltransferase 7 [Tribolium castaneum]|uniref:Lysophospholipid acyltransferase 7 n=1 Tax=Tribolium castaneum TaxID=7070 RepID=D6WX87_TRICA|nr:PREDICTED: lysophospholipid acyltransferase 7 [Tribolium castaneum]EFA08021.2 Lysophospholipid acyltransferase 7-like Protein [Tribolium castaneum]|eukprot:XP_973277.1 PREDICTED: lysophospholipid acyltransferase 7 [Tribolium castaneum]
MNYDDVVYLCLLFFSIAFGYYYRTIKDKDLKKNVGTAVGLCITLIVSGIHILHSFVTVFVNILIILFVNKKQCHLASFAFSFLYLLFFRSTIHFGIPYPPAHTNLVQMILTLKLVGLAFEVNSTHNSRKKRDTSEKNQEERDEDEANRIEPTCLDIIHYAFNYVGVLTGPYYRYRTFVDSLNFPFSEHADWKKATIDKLKYVPLYSALFLWGSYYWPISYAMSDEFYERSWLYRYWYIWPNFFIFRMRIYIGIVLSECVCTMAGLGAYPTLTNPKPGQGPSEKFHEMKKLISNEDALKKTDYDFETIHNINPYGADFCTTYREAMKHWNICIQYWLAVNVYKRFPSKKYRTAVTMLVSSFWHGVYSGYYVCIGTAPLCLMLEDVYYKLYLKDGKGPYFKVLEWVHWFFRMHFFSYQGIAFLLLEVNLILKYYNSIYHAGLVLWVILYVVGFKLLKDKRRREKKIAEKAAKNE